MEARLFLQDKERSTRPAIIRYGTINENLYSMRDALQQVMSETYQEAASLGLELGSPAIQEEIFAKFKEKLANVQNDFLENFGQQYQGFISTLDSGLRKYVGIKQKILTLLIYLFLK